MMKKALVIGSEGNIGAPLVRHLRSAGVEVLESDIKPGWRDGYLMADINHPVDLMPAFDWKPDAVFLLSAIVSRVTCEQASSLAISTNLGGVNNVLQLAKRTGSRVVFFSTSEVYGPECDPMDERVSDPKPNNRYGLSKLLGEQIVEYEVRTHGLKACVLRPFMVYDEELAAHQRCGARHRGGGGDRRVCRDQHRPSRRTADRSAGRHDSRRARRRPFADPDQRAAVADDARQAADAGSHADAARRDAED
jgi:nucleoside-diphosphate-sugar epimerase